jgi:CubicO group peptidase (beta-lactamase class C family)
VTGARFHAGSELVDSTGDQERRFARAFQLLDDAIAQRAFPGAALAVTLRGALLAWRGFGRFTYDADSEAVTRETVWDLASLTKAIATTSMAMLLFERGHLALDARIVELLPEFADAAQGPGAPADVGHATEQREWRGAVTVRMLLAHSSGLPAHRKLYVEASGREAMLAAARRVRLESKPGTRSEYSDIGFLVLGELLEQIAGEPLDVFCGREVFSPLNSGMRFVLQPDHLMLAPPTVNDVEHRGRVVQGEVNDENASAMGGVAGDAGLFGDAGSVARFAQCLLRGGKPVFRAETVELFTARQDGPEGSSRALGWDTPSAPSQSGTMFSARSFGHLGYTGTSLWCDAERGLGVTLLTNRTWPDARNQAIREVRPRVHDAIVRALKNE